MTEPAIWEYRAQPLGWLRSKWCARFHRRHVAMGYDNGTAVAACRKCGRMVVVESGQNPGTDAE